MKNKIKISLLTFMMLIMSIVTINAAPNVSLLRSSGTIKVGESVTFTIRNSSSEYSIYGTLKVSGAASASKVVTLAESGSDSITVTAKQSGTISVSFSGTYSGASTGFTDKNLNTLYNSATVSSGGSGGGGSTNPPVKQETPAEKEARLKREKEAKEAAEKAKQEEEAAKLKNTPLITSIEVISNDEKRNGKVLSNIETKFETFDYSYELPTYIENVKFNVTKLDEEVFVDFVEESVVDNEKVIVFKASKGDVSQLINLKLTPNTKDVVKTENGTVYEDEMLDKNFEELGFEIVQNEVNEQMSTLYKKGDLNLQMLINDDKEVFFNRLNDEGVVLGEGQLFIADSNVFFIVNSEDEEVVQNKLYGNAYDLVELPVAEFIAEVDESLTMKQNSKGWKYEEGNVVFALNEDGVTDLYNIDETKSIKSAVVAFDGSSNNDIFIYGFIASTVAFIVTAIMFILYRNKTKKQIKNVLARYSA